MGVSRPVGSALSADGVRLARTALVCGSPAPMVKPCSPPRAMIAPRLTPLCYRAPTYSSLLAVVTAVIAPVVPIAGRSKPGDHLPDAIATAAPSCPSGVGEALPVGDGKQCFGSCYDRSRFCLSRSSSWRSCSVRVRRGSFWRRVIRSQFASR